MKRFVTLIMCFLMSFTVSKVTYCDEGRGVAQAFTPAIEKMDPYKDYRQDCDKKTLKCRQDGIYSDEYLDASRWNTICSVLAVAFTALGMNNLRRFGNPLRRAG